jgi:uncharacterized protein YdhG (YjbR/CyaY superfamily)
VPNTSPEVDQFMASLDHPLTEGVQRLRTAILASNDTITEHIKWNAPSFRHGGQDRLTFHLQAVTTNEARVVSLVNRWVSA